MRRLIRVAWLLAIMAGLAAGPGPGRSSIARAADDPADVTVLAAEADALAARQTSLADAAPEGTKLVAYLDCGTQRESSTSEEVKITWVSGKPYRFQSEAAGVPATQPTIFFDESEVVFRLDGVDRARRYTVGFTWWDYDDGGRTQSVLVGSPDGRLVRLAVSAIRLPNYESDGQLPAERRFQLPAVFARNGQMRLTVQRVTGANVVISELWIWRHGD